MARNGGSLVLVLLGALLLIASFFRSADAPLSERPWRLRLTSGQRLAILRSPRRPAAGAARA